MLAPFTLADEPWLTDPDTFDAELIEKFKGSGIDVFHIAEGIGGPSNAAAAVSRFIGLWNGFIATHSDHFMRIDSAADLASVAGSGKIGVLIGVQNSEHFEKLDDIDAFYSLGQRVSLLTYNSRNRIGDGCTERVDAGITDYGIAVVRRMNEVGMAVDVTHCGDRTTLDSIEVSRKPVLISHSNARALVPRHPRCKTDAAIMAMAAKGGVMGISGVRMFVRDREPTTIEHLIDHFDYVVQLVGVEHVGLGSDMDLEGYDALGEQALERYRSVYGDSYGFREKIDIEGVDHPKRVFDLTEGLIRRGYTDEDILLMLGGNFQRVLSEIWSPHVGASGSRTSP
jgi:membrane dipeptidase